MIGLPFNGRRGPDVRARPNLDNEHARLKDMFRRCQTLGPEKPQIVGGDAKIDDALFARLQCDLLKPLEFAHWARPAGYWIADIQLHDLLSGSGPVISDIHARVEHIEFTAEQRLIQFDRVILEPAVTQAVAE